MLTYKKFSSDLIWNYLSLAVLAASGIIINVFIANYYGAKYLGVFNQIFAIYALLSQISIGGLHYSTLKHISYNQNNLDTITLGFGGLVDGYWCYHQTCDTVEEMVDWMDNQARGYGNNATGVNNLVNSLDMITWWAVYSFFHMDEKPILNVYLD